MVRLTSSCVRQSVYSRHRLRPLVAAAESRGSKPLIKRPSGLAYKTILSIDGGGIRGIIPSLVLLRLEDRIKDYILENKGDIVSPELSQQITATDDFDIDLVDYFDFVAGTSVGSLIAAYIANRGKNCDKVLNNPEVIALAKANGLDLRKGGMELIKVAIQVYSKTIFPTPGPFSPIIRFIRPKYRATGLIETLEAAFGDSKTDELETGLLVTTYDLLRNSATSFIRSTGSGEVDPETFTVSVAGRDEPRVEEIWEAPIQEGLFGVGESPASEEVIMPSYAKRMQQWRGDLEIKPGLEYYLRDITLSSSSAPTFFPPARIRSLNNPDSPEDIFVDGGMVANNPLLQALTFVANDLLVPVKNIASLSIGCGTTDPTARAEKDPGIAWWLQSGKLVDVLQNGTGEYIQAVVDYWLYFVLGFKPGQYTRIQRIADPGSKEEGLLGEFDNVNAIDDLIEVGKKLADEEDMYLKKFVEDFIFKKAESS